MAAPVPGAAAAPPAPRSAAAQPGRAAPGAPEAAAGGTAQPPLPAVPGPAPAGGRRPRGRHKRRLSRHPNKAHPSAAGSGRARRLGMWTALHVGRAALLPSAQFIMCSAFPETPRQDPNQECADEQGNNARLCCKMLHT